MEKGRRDTVLLTVIAIATLLVAIVGATFAFFTAQLNGNNRTSTITIQSSTGGGVTFYSTNVTAENIYPREAAWAVKPFRVTYHNSNSTYAFKYKLYLNYTNNFGTDEVKYSIEQVNGYCNGANKVQSECAAAGGTWVTTNLNNANAVPAVASKYFGTGTVSKELLGEGTFLANAGDVVHSYTLTITYPDKGTNQNYTGGLNGTLNQGATLTAWVSIEESTNA